MRLRLILAATGVAAAVFAGTASAAPVGAPTLSEAGVSTFPTKAYVVTLPTRAKLNLSKLTVLENGRPVNGLQLTTPGATGAGNFGTILMIDSSLSMLGKPIRGAMAAARVFASRRNLGQQLALITFNANAHVLLPFTTDSPTISHALNQIPRQAYGTHMFDALLIAKQLMKDSGLRVGSIVFLSDGQNVGSTVSQDKALGELKNAHIRVFTVGLQSNAYHADTLKAIAATTGGTYSEASNPGQLAPIFSALGYTLSNEYILRYRSLAGPNKPVHLTVKVAGFPLAAKATYKSPALPTLSTAVYAKSSWDRLIQSTTTAALVIAALVALIGLAVFLALRQRDQTLQRRLGEFVSLPLEERAKVRRADVAATLERGRKRFSLSGFAWFQKLQNDVEIGRITMRPPTIVGLTVAAGLIIGVIIAAVVGSPLGLLAGLITPFVARFLVARRVIWMRKEFAEQLADNLDVLSSALRAGHSFIGALSVAVEDAGEPSSSELRRVVADEQLGVPLEEALRVTSQRMENRDLMQVALVARLQRDAGTNAAEVLDQVATNIRNRMEVWRLIRTLTAQGRMARWIVSILPVFLFGAILVLNRTYLSPLWQTNIGIAGLVAAGIMIVLGSLVIKRIVEIEV